MQRFECGAVEILRFAQDDNDLLLLVSSVRLVANRDLELCLSCLRLAGFAADDSRK
jgi:hypothetical protein